jgi:hypothetical protein
VKEAAVVRSDVDSALMNSCAVSLGEEFLLQEKRRGTRKVKSRYFFIQEVFVPYKIETERQKSKKTSCRRPFEMGTATIKHQTVNKNAISH